MPQNPAIQSIADKFYDMAQGGLPFWEKPWQATGYSFALPYNYTSGEYYRGMNIAALEITAMEKDYSSHKWMTYLQAQKVGMQVNRGEKGTQIIRYDTYAKPDKDGEEKYFGYVKAFSVFNECQMKGYELKENPQPRPIVDLMPEVDTFIANTGAVIVKGGTQCYYDRSTDIINVVEDDLWQATSDRNYLQNKYRVTFHEMGHWTGAESRLNREYGKKFGDPKYALEEGVADISASIVCSRLGIEPGPSAHTVRYVKGWLPELLENRNDIIPVVVKASEAAEYLFMMQNKADVSERTKLHPISPALTLNK